jgi:hypothetical protein
MYSLFFRPRSGNLEREQFLDYFRGRPHYQFEGTRAWYLNWRTGVNFVFLSSSAELEGPPGYPFSFNMHVFRPSYFILEAEPEVTALVKHFGLVVSDPHPNGMGEGDYDPHMLIPGWQHANEFAYWAMLEDKDKREIWSLPARRLHEIWRWNFACEALQEAVGELKIVATIRFVHLNGKLVTTADWPDAVSSLLPTVEYVMIEREELAPPTTFRTTTDAVFVEWAKILPVIEKYRSTEHEGAFDLDYSDCPPDIVHFVRELIPNEPSAEVIRADQVLDRELVDRSVTTQSRTQWCLSR